MDTSTSGICARASCSQTTHPSRPRHARYVRGSWDCYRSLRCTSQCKLPRKTPKISFCIRGETAEAADNGEVEGEESEHEEGDDPIVNPDAVSLHVLVAAYNMQYVLLCVRLCAFNLRKRQWKHLAQRPGNQCLLLPGLAHLHPAQ